MSTKHATLTTSLEGKIAAQTTALEGKLATETTSLKTEIGNFKKTCEAKTRTLQTVVNEIDTRTTSIENKPR